MKLPDMEGGKIKEKNMWSTAGDYVAVITGFGANVSQAAKRAYGTVDKLHVANPIIRDDVGECLEKELPLLHKMGYASHCHYA
ncbi:MAG: hypothetical protein NVSMB70_01740 [Chamaesiphon sp.]